MKESGKMTGNVENNRLKDLPIIYKAYAKYFKCYVNAYKGQGIDIDRICVQNETDISPVYPSCLMEPWQMVKFVSEYLNPTFKTYNLKSEIWPGTYRVAMWKGAFEALETFSDKEFRQSVSGIGIQYTDAKYINDFSTLYPEVRKMHTECECYNGDNSYAQAKNRLSEIANYINSGCENYMYWNIILDETSKSGWGGNRIRL